jgi:chitodextrinase
MTVTPDATTATLTWTADATNFEIEYKEVSADVWSQTIAVSNVTSYTITGLVPETDYMIRLRSVCEEGEYSAWKTTSITTPTLPCLAPTNVTATTIGLTSATITWTDPTNNQTSWTIEYGYGDNIQTVTATTTSVELTNLYSGTTYTVRVQGSCAADVYSDWSDAYSFTTATCQTVSNLVADGITSSSATITWTAPAGQTKWELSYGMQGVDEEHGTKVTVTVNPTFTIEGLEEDMSYDVYVRAVCGENTYSAWSTKLQFTTRPVSINTAANDNVNVRIYPNPANTEATISVEGINGKVEFAIADMNGRMIVTETINCDGQLVKTIDVSNLAKGAYFVHIYNDNFNTTRKLIVK